MGSGCEGRLLSTGKHFVRVTAPQGDSRERLTHDAVRDERSDVCRADSGRDDLDDVDPDDLEPARDLATRPENEAYERMLKSDVKYRFSIDMASLKSG